MTDLSNEELFALYHAETDECKKEDIRDFFFRKNERLPHFIASKFKNSNISHDDLTGLASIGMLKAFNSFKLDAGVKFATYATMCMNNEIFAQLRKEKRHGQNVSIETEVAVDSNGNSFTLLDTLSDGTYFELDVEQAELLREVKEVAPQILTDKEHFILFNYFSETPLNQKEIANKVGVSQSYISRLMLSAVEKLAKHFKKPKILIFKKEMDVLTNVVKAKVGNIVEWDSKAAGQMLRGKVLVVHENSAVVDLTIMPKWYELGLEERTVVSHSRYTIIEKDAFEQKTAEEIEVVPGSLENLLALREAGFSDGKIQGLWNKHDAKVNWHNSRFYKFKQDNGLMRGYKKEKAEAIEVEKSEQPLSETVEPVEVETEKTIDVEKPSIEPIFEQENMHDLVQQLQAELRATRNELWSERTARLFSMQAQLDALICESNKLQIADYETEHILATIVELGEVAQEEQSFKYWKKQKDVDREALLEEVSDVMHFIISRGVQRGFKRVAYTDAINQGETVSEQMLLLIEQLLHFRNTDAPLELYIELFNSFRVFVDMLGFNWQDISDAYGKKHKENISRQNRNY